MPETDPDIREVRVTAPKDWKPRRYQRALWCYLQDGGVRQNMPLATKSLNNLDALAFQRVKTQGVAAGGFGRSW